MKPPTSRKEVRQLIGVVNYYPDMWTRRSHMLAPLTKITPNKRKYKWTKIEEDAFNGIKRIVYHQWELLIIQTFSNRR